MKVLKPGFKRGDWKMVVTCTGNGSGNVVSCSASCGAELEVNADDLYYVSTGGRLDDVQEYSYSVRIRCPECGYETAISPKLIPSFLSKGMSSRDDFFANR